MGASPPFTHPPQTQKNVHEIPVPSDFYTYVGSCLTLLIKLLFFFWGGGGYFIRFLVHRKIKFYQEIFQKKIHFLHFMAKFHPRVISGIGDPFFLNFRSGNLASKIRRKTEVFVWRKPPLEYWSGYATAIYHSCNCIFIRVAHSLGKLGILLMSLNNVWIN